MGLEGGQRGQTAPGLGQLAEGPGDSGAQAQLELLSLLRKGQAGQGIPGRQGQTAFDAMPRDRGPWDLGSQDRHIREGGRFPRMRHELQTDGGPSCILM